MQVKGTAAVHIKDTAAVHVKDTAAMHVKDTAAVHVKDTVAVQVKDTVAVHVPCSSKKMGIEAAFMNLAGRCAASVQPSGVPCCGMAGDRGMRFPELTASSLQHLNTAGCSDGYSTSRTCEMSLSNHSGVNFRGLVYLCLLYTSPSPRD